MSWPTPARMTRDSEEGRQFLQQRIGLFSGAMFLLVLAIMTVGITAIFTTQRDRLRVPPVHVLPMLGLGFVWLRCRRGPVSPRALDAMDALVTVAVGAGAAVAAFVIPRELPSAPAISLAVTHLTIARAITIPSEPSRTAWISAAAVTPALVVFAASPHLLGLGASADATWLARIMLSAWSVAAVVVATWTSRVLYGLRARVEEARRLGQYTLEGVLGKGGMGTVYRAKHALLRRPTAIKLLPPEKAGQANIQRFEREVQLTSQLSHPNTIAIYDFGRTHDGIFYYVMEYLEGVDLQLLVERDGPQPASRAIHILSQVCGALTEAHGVGLIHRDIKPSNVILCEHGGLQDVAKVVDFGLVKESAADDADLKLTGVNTMPGTPLYLSPEAITTPESVDARSDLYALGAVGYFLLTGTVPFEGKSVMEVCGHHLHTAPVPPSERLGRAVPADLEALILACLAKKPDDRPRDARALKVALAACGDAAGWTEEAARRWWSEHKETFRRRAEALDGSRDASRTVGIDLHARR